MATNYSISSTDFYNYYIPQSLINQFVLTGTLWTWGSGASGRLGNNATTDRSSPVQTVAGGTNWVSTSACSNSTPGTAAGIKSDGTLWMWGQNNSGQLGVNDTFARSSPVQTVAAGSNWRQVAVGYQAFTAAIKTSGQLWTWGAGLVGQLGDGTAVSKSSPVQTIAAGTNWAYVSAGYIVGAAIKTDGTLWLWGAGTWGVLGNNATTDRSSPVQTVAGGTNWQQVSCGTNVQVAAIKTDGTLWTWGLNQYGQLGDNTTVNKSSPVQTIAAGTNWSSVASGGRRHFAAIKTDGTLWTWGGNVRGQLGDNTIVDKSSPIQTVSGGANWRQVGCGYSVTGAVKQDGTLWTWGFNTNGQLGNSTTTNRSSPIQTTAGGNNWKQVSPAGASMYGIYFYDAYNLYPN